MTDIERDELEQVAAQLESEVPWATTGKSLAHDGWMDLVETIKTVWPEAYALIRQDVMERTLHQEQWGMR